MKMQSTQIKQFTFISIILLFVSCNSPKIKELPNENDHPKMIKTIGNPNYGNVNCILQDKAGILWFGTTENGLYSYDGKSFKRFLKADGLNSNEVYCLFEENPGKLWIGTGKGLCIYDGIKFSEIKIPFPKNLPPNENPNYINKHWVYDIIQAKNGHLWFATIDGVYIYNGQSFSYFEINEAENGYLTKSDKAERILEDKDGNIWFGNRTNKGVFRYDGKSITNLSLGVLFQNGPKPKPTEWGWPQLQDKYGNIWFSNWGGAYKYDGTSITTFTKENGLPGIVTIIMEDKKGNLWFGGEGICRYDGNSFTCYTEKDGLNTSGVWSILEDNNGNIWVGTRETGLFLFDGNKFISYSEFKK